MEGKDDDWLLARDEVGRSLPHSLGLSVLRVFTSFGNPDQETEPTRSCFLDGSTIACCRRLFKRIHYLTEDYHIVTPHVLPRCGLSIIRASCRNSRYLNDTASGSSLRLVEGQAHVGDRGTSNAAYSASRS